MSDKLHLNKGDAFKVEIDYTVNDIPIADADLDEIELYVGDNRFLLSDGSIVLNPETHKLECFISQEMTFRLSEFFKTQIRVKKGDEVSSVNIQTYLAGKVISEEVI